MFSWVFRQRGQSGFLPTKGRKDFNDKGFPCLFALLAGGILCLAAGSRVLLDSVPFVPFMVKVVTSVR
jgi:hypothetical protein